MYGGRNSSQSSFPEVQDQQNRFMSLVDSHVEADHNLVTRHVLAQSPKNSTKNQVYMVSRSSKANLLGSDD